MHVAAVARVRRRGRPPSGRADARSARAAPSSINPAASAGRPASPPIPSRSAARHSRLSIAQRLGRRRQQQQLRVARKRLDALEEGVLDAARQRARVGQPEPARELRRRQSARQLDQRERVAARLVEDPGLHPLVERPGDRRVQQQRGRRRRRALRSRAPAARRARRSSPDSRTANTNPTRSASSRRATNASVCADTRSSHCASSTMHTSGCSSAASASRLRTASPTRKRSGGGPALQAERRAQRVALRARQTLEPAEHRRAQRVQAGERELHLGLDAGRPGDPASRPRPPTGAAAGRSCRRPPRRAAPAPGSGPHALPRRVVPARRAR